MNESSSNAKLQVRELRILIGALMTGAFLIFAMLNIFIIGKVPHFEFHEAYLAFNAVGIGLTLLALIGSPIIFSQLANKIDMKENITLKLEKYRRAYIPRMAMIEGPLLVNILFYAFMDNSIILFANCIILWMYMAFNWPSSSRITTDLQLDKEDRDALL